MAVLTTGRQHLEDTAEVGRFTVDKRNTTFVKVIEVPREKALKEHSGLQQCGGTCLEERPTNIQAHYPLITHAWASCHNST